jgi:serine protease Do
VQAGDVIVSLDGRSVDRVSALQRIVRAKQPGDVVAVKLMRYGKQLDYRVKLTEMKVAEAAVLASAGGKGAPKKDTNAGARLGIDVAPVTDEFVRAGNLPDRYKGLSVTGVLPDGPATKFGPNDVIVASMPNHDPIRSEADLKKLLAGKKAGDVVSLEVVTPVEDNKGKVTQQTRVVNLKVGDQ